MAEAFFFLDVIEEEVNIEEEEEDDRRRMTAVMKEIGHSVDPFSLEDRVFRKHFRLCKEAATNLVEELSPHLNAGRRVSKLTVNTRVSNFSHMLKTKILKVLVNGVFNNNRCCALYNFLPLDRIRRLLATIFLLPSHSHRFLDVFRMCHPRCNALQTNGFVFPTQMSKETKLR